MCIIAGFGLPHEACTACVVATGSALRRRRLARWSSDIGEESPAGGSPCASRRVWRELRRGPPDEHDRSALGHRRRPEPQPPQPPRGVARPILVEQPRPHPQQQLQLCAAPQPQPREHRARYSGARTPWCSCGALWTQHHRQRLEGQGLGFARAAGKQSRTSCPCSCHCAPSTPGSVSTRC